MGEPDLTPGSPAWGDRSQVPPDARLECKICWWVYDPAEGDAVWQIPPGTPFSGLPSSTTEAAPFSRKKATAASRTA